MSPSSPWCGCGMAGWLVPVPSCSALWPFWGWRVDASAGQFWGCGGWVGATPADRLGLHPEQEMGLGHPLLWAGAS